ncbi:MAG: hypothetical protein MK132_09725 [Lentisphaerales bacterium]|nr:hypothetical protein [Lentisphaerales bacterium]
MKFIFVLNFLIIASPFAVERKSSELVEVNKKIAAIMGMMHLPGMGVSTLAGKGDYKSKYFKQASSDFVLQTRKMATVKHPDKAFRAFNDEMLKCLKTFEEAVAAEKSEEIRQSWKAVMTTCQSCHSVYHAKQK